MALFRDKFGDGVMITEGRSVARRTAMREIKFRGLDEHGDWHYGAFMGVFFDGVVAPIEYANIYDDGMANRVLPDTVGQFTGLHDANGREIYEGDVIKLDNEVYTVSWAKYSACWFVDLKNFGPSLFTQYHAGKSIVIGNVHDNPELLKRKP